MSSKASTKKLKKPLELPLGKASSQKEIDLSHVRLPIDTSVFGLKQVLTLFETATNEVKSYLAYECDLMYECRLCRTIFRSLANFILHKRKYCKDKYTISEDPSQKCREADAISVIQKDIQAANKIIIESEDSVNGQAHRRQLNPIIERLLKNQENRKFVDNIKNEKLSDKSKLGKERSDKPFNKILLERIDTSDVAVFQTTTAESNLGSTEFMKSQVMEIHSIFDNDEAVVGTDGKVLTCFIKKDEDKHPCRNTVVCTECNIKFSTKKTLAYHVKYKHNNSRLVYSCPECKDTFANAWCVYRHLFKVHRKSSTQIKKLRNQIHNGAMCRKVEDSHPKARKCAKEEREDNDEENEWLDNVEGDNDLQMCGGCGKRFERKAALTSHAVMCTKRIAICNSIKENNARRKEADDRETKGRSKTSKSSKRPLFGSAKRKPESLITYKPKTDDSPVEIHTVHGKGKTQAIYVDAVRVEHSKQIVEQCNDLTDHKNNKEESNISELELQQEFVLSEINPRSPITDKQNSDISSKELDIVNREKQERASIEDCVEVELLKEITDEPADEVVTIISDDESSTKNSKNGLKTCPTEEENIISVDLNNFDHGDSASSDSQGKFPSKLSDCSDSPCRGFESTQPSRFSNFNKFFSFREHVESASKYPVTNTKDDGDSTLNITEMVGNLHNEVCTLSVDDQSKGEIINILNVPAECEPTNYENSESLKNTEDKGEVNLEISLNNNNPEESTCGKYELSLCDDLVVNQFSDSKSMSFKSLIKDIMNEEQYNTEYQDSNEERNEILNENGNMEENSDINTTLSDGSKCPILYTSSDDSCSSSTAKPVSIETEFQNEKSHNVYNQSYTKRKRTESHDEIKTKKSSHIQSQNEEPNTGSIDEAFFSRITPYSDMPTLSCSLCNSQFDSLSHLLFHMAIHISWYRYQCSRCLFMSYNKYDCESHVHKEHQLPFSKIQNTVLPIPTWKAASISDNEIDLTPISKSEEPVILEQKESLLLNTEMFTNHGTVMGFQFKPVKYEKTEEVSSEEKPIVDFIDLTIDTGDDNSTETNLSEVEANPVESNVLINNTEMTMPEVNDQVLPDIPKHTILGVILRNERKKRNDKLKDIHSSVTEYVRPPRNRVKSIKTSQKDFIYDYNMVRSKSLKGNSSNMISKQLKVSEVIEDNIA